MAGWRMLDRRFDKMRRSKVATISAIAGMIII